MTCNFQPPDRRYAPCTRAKGHAGPCSHAPHRRKLVGLCGLIGSGKDATYAQAVTLLGVRNVDRLAFGDELKKEIAETLGFTVSFINANKPRFRGVLQWWGTEYRRHDDEDYWVKKVEAALPPMDEDRWVFITDVRFPNEVDMLRRQGGVLIRVERAGVTPLNDHASEHAIMAAQPDAVLRNDGTLDDLLNTLDETLYRLFPCTSVSLPG